MGPRCAECLGEFHLWSDGLHHWERWRDHDHEPTDEMSPIVYPKPGRKSEGWRQDA